MSQGTFEFGNFSGEGTFPKKVLKGHTVRDMSKTRWKKHERVDQREKAWDFSLTTGFVDLEVVYFLLDWWFLKPLDSKQPQNPQ